MKEIYLIRHAESFSNLNSDEYIFGIDRFTPLTENGINQAKIKGDYFEKYYNFNNALFLCSSTVRTLDTANIILNKIFKKNDVNYTETNDVLHIDDSFVEIDVGLWDGRKKSEIPNFNLIKFMMNLQKGSFRFPGGESINDLSKRMISGIEKYVHDSNYDKYVIFTHGVAIKAFLLKILNIKYKNPYFSPVVNNCSLTIVNYDNYNYVNHQVTVYNYLHSEY